MIRGPFNSWPLCSPRFLLGSLCQQHPHGYLLSCQGCPDPAHKEPGQPSFLWLCSRTPHHPGPPVGAAALTGI